jgi:RNA polymerase sigma factor (sigma-70 family)
MPVKELPREKTPLRAVDQRASRKSDRDLVHGCLQKRDEDWNLLIDKYKNLIFSIPLRYGFSRDEAADVFQSVCLDLIQDLSKLKDPQALPKWLMQVTSHKCFHWKRQRARLVLQEDEETQVPEAAVQAEAEVHLREVEQEQILREARAGLPPRCQELIRMLFCEEPARPYQEVAASLGLATGSIGLLRQKCLDRLRTALDTLGFS